LEAAIRFELEDYSGCKAFVEQSHKSDPDTIANEACLLLKEGNIEEAYEKYSEASRIVGFRADLVYGGALCHYMLKNYVGALKEIAEIIERGIRDHPELSVGMATEGIEVRSVGNSQLLHQTYLVEAFNLKAAIEYNLRNCNF
jgi:tetratricopeptide repeat protein 30